MSASFLRVNDQLERCYIFLFYIILIYIEIITYNTFPDENIRVETIFVYIISNILTNKICMRSMKYENTLR